MDISKIDISKCVAVGTCVASLYTNLVIIGEEGQLVGPLKTNVIAIGAGRATSLEDNSITIGNATHKNVRIGGHDILKMHEELLEMLREQAARITELEQAVVYQPGSDMFKELQDNFYKIATVQKARIEGLESKIYCTNPK